MWIDPPLKIAPPADALFHPVWVMLVKNYNNHLFKGLERSNCSVCDLFLEMYILG